MELRRTRNREAERQERDSFILLQHACTLASASPYNVLSGTQMAVELGFGRDEALHLTELLVREGFFTDRGAGPRISISQQGVEYLERLAWRRRTVRFRDRGGPPDPAP